MATSRNPYQFARRFAIIANVIRKNTIKTVKRAAIAADQAVVLATPVDTGRLRANWLVTVGVPASGETSFAKGRDGSTKGPATNDALSQGRDMIKTWKLGSGGIFITNNVRYGPIIDAGYSAQAPRGMTAKGILAASRQLGFARLLEGV